VGAIATTGLVATTAWFAMTGAGEVIRNFSSAALLAAAATFALTTVNLLLRWLRWGFLLRRHHVRLPTRDTFRLFFMTLPAVLTPLYLGELVRVAIVSRNTRRAGPAVFWTWLVERSSDLGALVVLFGVAAGRPALAVGGAAILLVTPWWLARRSLRDPEHRRLHTGQMRTVSVVWICAGLSLVAWTLPALSAWITLLLIAGVADPSVAVSAFTEGTLLGGLTGIPGGTAVTGSTTILSLLSAGVPAPQATAAVAILRAGTTWYAVGLGTVLLVVWRHDLLRLVRPAATQVHFDALADHYADELSEYVRQRLLERKIGAMSVAIATPEAGRSVAGLDLGCGQAWYAAELALAGYRMAGVDTSAGQIRNATEYCERMQASVDLHVIDGGHLPFEGETFDFAYSINVLHHVTTPQAQVATLAEVVRVLKPGGVFFLHEMNIENPVFRLYMSYVFPLLRNIDEGTELWIRPTHLPAVPGAVWASECTYFTFLPDFLPSVVQQWLAPLERWLERSAFRRYSAHYMVKLERSAQATSPERSSTSPATP